MTELERALALVAIGLAIVLVPASYFLERSGRWRRALDAAFLLAGSLAAASYLQTVLLRDFVHAHEQFHFLLGSKYLAEVRYDGIYEAAILAVDELGVFRGGHPRRRDPMTFEMQTGQIRTERAAEIRSRFTHDRWVQFQRDTWFLWTKAYVVDHGNTGSPAWALSASAFTRTMRYDGRTQRLLGALDTALLVILFGTAVWAFGPRSAGLAMILGLAMPGVCRFIIGSILRIDWIFALGMSLCLFHRRFLRSAGLFLGYAVASKLLAGVFILPLGLRFLLLAVKRRSLDRDMLRYISFAVTGLAAAVLLSGLMFGFRIWPDYAERMVTTFQEHYYQRNHSLRDLFLQARHDPASLGTPTPTRVAASRDDVHIADVRGAYSAVQLALLLGLALVASRQRDELAFALGPLSVFTMLVTNRYYWQMWVVSGLALAGPYRGNWFEPFFAVAILLWTGAMWLVEGSTTVRAGYFGGYLLGGMMLLLFAAEALRTLRARTRSG